MVDMKLFSRGEWQYAILMILLLFIAAIASVQTIGNIDRLVRSLDDELAQNGMVLHEKDAAAGIPVFNEKGEAQGFVAINWDSDSSVSYLLRTITMTIYALTFGFILLTGAFGLWAVRFTAEIEGKKRVGRFVDDMDYLRDGLLVLDKKGLVTGMNPAARKMAAKSPSEHTGIREMFPGLSGLDAQLLLKPSRPHEIERPGRTEEGQRIWRFRSQPSEDMDLVLISDVTEGKVKEMRQRQAANLQIVGRIAQGVAHDFNNILCAISGHASLLDMSSSDAAANEESLQAILKESQRGANLAAHLLELSRSGKSEHPTERLNIHVEKAVELLKVGLSSAWSFKTEFAEKLPVVPMSPLQVEQAVLNLGLIAADQCAGPGVLTVSVRHPKKGFDLDIDDEYGVLILISSQDTSEEDAPENPLPKNMFSTIEEAGVIQSVVRAMVEEVGGGLDIMHRSGHRSYRIGLPAYSTAQEPSSPPVSKEDLSQFLTQWNIMVAMSEALAGNVLKKKIEQHGAYVEIANDIVGTLSRLDKENAYRAIIIDRNLLGAEADGLLKAILKLQPKAGLVVLSDNIDAVSGDLKTNIIFEDSDADADVLTESLLRACALRRK